MRVTAKSVPSVALSVIFIIAALALVQLAPVILSQWQGTKPCPAIGPIRVCYIVGFGYAAMALATVVGIKHVGWLFVVGWVPVFLMALIGASLELTGRPTCPVTSTGIPMCYFSLAIAALILLPAFLIARRMSGQSF